MIEAFLRTFKEILSPFFWVIIILNLIITGLFFWLLIWGSGELIAYVVADYEWLKSLVGAGAVIVSYMMFPIIFPLISYLFQDFITAHLNKKHNREGKEIKIPISTIIGFALKFAALSIFLNLILLPLYFIPVVGLVTYFCLNSFLLGREYYQLSAYTLLEGGEVKQFRNENSKLIFISGIVLSLFFLTPILNLIAPIIGVIFSWFYVFKLTKKYRVSS